MADWFITTNNAKTTLSEDIAGAETDWDVTDGSVFPATGDFLVTCWDKVTYPDDPGDDPNMEIARCTSRAGNTLTVVKDQESTGDNTHSSGDAIEQLMTAGLIDQLKPVMGEIPTGDMDGVNAEFTLANTPIDTDKVAVYLQGNRQSYTNDFTVAGDVITFVEAPESWMRPPEVDYYHY